MIKYQSKGLLINLSSSNLCFFFSRAINFKICYKLDVSSFLRALQLHIFQWGLPEKVLSDLGASIVPAGNIIKDFLKDQECQKFLQINNINGPVFEHVFVGAKHLQGICEIGVKMTKKLIFGTIQKKVLPLQDFEYVVEQTISLVNKRPICFKEGLRNYDPNEITFEPITPEIILKGYYVTDLNIEPGLQPEQLGTWEKAPIDSIRTSYEKLRVCRQKLIDLYKAKFT